MKKNLELNEIVEEIKDMLEDVVNPADTVVEITEDLEKAKDNFKEVIKPRKGDPADKDLYARVIAEAKAKFDVYPSAYANGWVVQEYKRRGGKYKISKSEGIEDGFEESEIEDDLEINKAEHMYKSEHYESDNEEEDKWSNMEKACWTGYVQQGMKDKGGRMVPNCVPVEKMEDLSEADMVSKSFWSGSFNFKK